MTPAGTSATSASDQYTYSSGPTVSSVSPTVGPTAGGTSVTVNGANLSGATAVTFGTTAGTGVVVNGGGTSLTVNSPAGVVGTVDVTVTTPGGTSADQRRRPLHVPELRATGWSATTGGSSPSARRPSRARCPALNIHVTNVVGMVPTSTGKGYWMVGSDGGVFAFGDAGFVGSLPGLGVHVSNIVGVVPTSYGQGLLDGGLRRRGVRLR